MATEMRLHREETFQLITEDSTPEAIIRAESARRTLVSAFMVDYLLLDKHMLFLPLIFCTLTQNFVYEVDAA